MSTRVGDEGLRRALVALCLTEIASWGILYYSLPVAAADITATEGWSHGEVFTAFSSGLVLSALAGARVGRLLDRFGPRPVMTLGSAVGAVGLLLVATAPDRPTFFAAWLVIGLGQSATLYPPAFTAITRWYGDARTWPLTAVTLVGGLASTVFAPLTDALVSDLGWRGAYLLLAASYAVVTVPLHGLLLTPAWPGNPARIAAPARRRVVRLVVRGRRFVALQASLTLIGLALFAVTLNLIPLLTDRGLDHRLAAVVFGLVGAGQVAGRVAFAVLPAGRSPQVRTVTIGLAAVAALVLLGILPGPAAALAAVAVVTGAVRGAFTLLQATAVADRWGTRYFGAMNGVFSVPITAAVALAPAAGAVATDLLGGHIRSTLAFAAVAAVGLLVGRRA